MFVLGGNPQVQMVLNDRAADLQISPVGIIVPVFSQDVCANMIVGISIGGLSEWAGSNGSAQ